VGALGDVRALRVVGIGALGSSVLALVSLPLPVVWVAAAWAAFCMLWTLQRKSFVAFNIALALLALAAIEAVLGLQPRAWHWGDYENADYFERDDDLGYLPRPGQRATHEKYLGDELLYSVVYTIDENGLRSSNPDDTDLAGECVLFFGGSFVFGEGLNDADTLPHLASERLGAAVSTRNFGLHGYGPHHVLAMIESGRVRDAADCAPRAAVYLAIEDHVYRAAGLRWWDRRGPRFALDGEGKAQRRGNFDDGEDEIDAALRFVQKKSEIAKRVRERTRALEARDFELYFALLEASKVQLEALYPGIEVLVLEWDLGHQDGSQKTALRNGFAERGLPVESFSSILEAAGRGRDGLTIPRDGHPTRLANEILADQVVRRLAARESRGDGPP